ncbi:MAG: hypothetical protein R6U70_03675 [Bacillota bacterium]
MSSEDWYDRLRVDRIINGVGTSTHVGGSLMPDEVLRAMEQAARDFVDLRQLQQRAGEHIARLTGNEACYICAGSSSGLFLAAAACMTGNDPGRIRRLPDTTGMPNEFLVHRTHMNPYDRIIPVAGARLVEFGYARYTKPWQMEEAITENTAGVFYFFYRGGWRHEHSALTLQETIDIAHSHDLRVIVDAAGQLPPPENLRRFTAMGADLVVFSGGKGLRGPQSSGLLFGPRDLIQACQLMGPPNHNIGRSMKVPKEEIVGLVAAVERYLSLDHQREIENYEKVVARLVEAISGISGLQASRRMPGDSGEPYPFCEVRFPGENATARRDWMVENLLNWDPPIYVSSILPDCVSINALCLGEGQEETIIEAISDLSRQMPADPAENAGA